MLGTITHQVNKRRGNKMFLNINNTFRKDLVKVLRDTGKNPNTCETVEMEAFCEQMMKAGLYGNPDENELEKFMELV